MKIIARAPSNIAFIKYMGKKPGLANVAENASLSMTLTSLCTVVEARITEDAKDFWAAGAPELSVELPYVPGELSEEGRARALKHVARVRAALPNLLAGQGLAIREGSFGLELRSANTFPASSGIASSASSFAAITLAIAAASSSDLDAFSKAYEASDFKRSLARLSREGSGSSCRSFEGPFVYWDGDESNGVAASLPKLAHFVVLISSAAKAVSSSEAHERVKDSPLWTGRIARANQRALKLRAALAQDGFSEASRIAWQESWEMHSLFHTSAEPFSYWEPETIGALHWLAPQIGRPNGAIVTMDAGPNIHITVDASSADHWRAQLIDRFGLGRVLQDSPGTGASLVL